MPRFPSIAVSPTNALAYKKESVSEGTRTTSRDLASFLLQKRPAPNSPSAADLTPFESSYHQPAGSLEKTTDSKRTLYGTVKKHEADLAEILDP